MHIFRVLMDMLVHMGRSFEILFILNISLEITNPISFQLFLDHSAHILLLGVHINFLMFAIRNIFVILGVI